MKKLCFACMLMLCMAVVVWAQGGAQTNTSGSATLSSPGQSPAAPAPPQQPPAGTPNDDDAQMSRPASGDARPPQGEPGAASAPAGDTPQQTAAGSQATTMVHAELSKSLDAKKAKAGDEVTAKTTTDFRTSTGTRVPRGTKLLGRVTEARKHDKDAGTEGQSKLAFVFDRAVLKDKSEIPVSVVVQAIGAAQALAPAPGADPGMGASTAGSGQASAGGPGLMGGAAGTAGSTVGGVTGAAGQTVGGVGDAAAGTVGAATGAAGDVAGSGGAVNAGGRLTAQSQGIIGLEALKLESAASGDTQAAVVTSDQKNVKLNSGTQLVLRVSAQ